jgi:hypothetical protein
MYQTQDNRRGLVVGWRVRFGCAAHVRVMGTLALSSLCSKPNQRHHLGVPLMAPVFDIFSGRSPDDKNVRWLEAVEGLENACERMHVLAALTPGPYFVLNLADKEVLAFVDTTSK